MKNWYQMSQTQVMKEKRTDETGLTGADAAKRLEQCGSNILKEGKKKEPVTGIWRAVSGSSGDHIDHCSSYFRYFR